MWQLNVQNLVDNVMKNVGISQASISLDSCTEFSKTQFFPVIIVKNNL